MEENKADRIEKERMRTELTVLNTAPAKERLHLGPISEERLSIISRVLEHLKGRA